MSTKAEDIDQGETVEAAPNVKRGTAGGRGDEPLYMQVARILRDEIVQGRHPVGSQLPTEDELRARFSVSRFTVREALRRLREDGLVQSRQGAGTVVVPSQVSDSYVHNAMSINDLLAFVADKRLDIDLVKMVRMDEKLAARCDLTAGDEWLYVRGLRRVEGNPAAVALTEYHINRDYAAVGRLLHRHQGPIFPLLEDMFAISIAEVHQEIGAIEVVPDLGEAFDVAPGSPALEVIRTFKEASGKVAQITVNTHPGPRFRHSMTMRRVRS